MQTALWLFSVNLSCYFSPCWRSSGHSIPFFCSDLRPEFGYLSIIQWWWFLDIVAGGQRCIIIWETMDQLGFLQDSWKLLFQMLCNKNHGAVRLFLSVPMDSTDVYPEHLMRRFTLPMFLKCFAP